MAAVVTTDRLRCHAGLAAVEDDQSRPSLSRCVEPEKFSGNALKAAMADFIEIMVLVNVELNGSIPSESTEGANEIPRDVAYAVAEIIHLLRHARSDVDEVRASLERAVWMVEVAWLAILAGDIDDLPAHLAGEEHMRGDA